MHLLHVTNGICWHNWITKLNLTLTLIHTHVMIDTWHLIVYLTWHILYCVLSTLLFIYFMHVTSYLVYFYSSIVVICTHCFCTCTFPFILTHSLGRFLTTLDLNIQIHVYSILLIMYLEIFFTYLTRSQSSLTWSSLLSILLLSFIHVIPFDFVHWIMFYSFIPMLSLC